MIPDDPEDRLALAGEYVLGTLPGAEAREFEEALAGDGALRDLVADWEAWLAPLAATVPPVEPSAELWARVERSIAPAPAPRPAAPVHAGLWESVALWRGLASGFAVAAAVLALMVATLPLETTPPGPRLAAVLETAEQEPSFLVQADAEGAITVTPIRVVSLDPDRALELWTAGADGVPVSLGLLAADGPSTVPADRAAQIAPGQPLMVSLEPAGGSPEPGPTGPVVYSGTSFASPL